MPTESELVFLEMELIHIKPLMLELKMFAEIVCPSTEPV